LGKSHSNIETFAVIMTIILDSKTSLNFH